MPTTGATQLIDIAKESSVVVAFSGGADSLALLLLLSRMLNPDHLIAVYVNHRLRPEAELDREERLNASNCRAIRVPLRIIRLERGAVEQLARKRGNGIEDAARVLRYAALERVRFELGFSCIATAHTADDQAETLLMRMLQGAGPSALKGIAMQRGHVVRPLLRMRRTQVLEVVNSSALTCSEDSTNADDRFLRNRIRHEIIPVIANVFPRYREALDALARQSRRLVDALEPLVNVLYGRAVQEEERKVIIDLRQLAEASDAVVEQLIFRCWHQLQIRKGQRLSHRTVERLLELIRSETAGVRIAVAGTNVVVRGNVLLWEKASASLAGGFVSLVYSDHTPLDGERLLVRGNAPDSPVPIHQRARIHDEDIVGDLMVRSTSFGDRIVLLEGTKKISDLMASWKVPIENRWRIPVLEDHEGIVAVLGGAYGGRDRVAKRCISGTLARNEATLYSVTDIEG